MGWPSQQKLPIPRKYAEEGINVGDPLFFHVETREEVLPSGKFTLVEEMNYMLSDGRSFGLKLLSSRKGYQVFPSKESFEFARGTDTANPFPPFKFFEFPPWSLYVPEDRDFFLNLQYGLRSLLGGLHYLGPYRVHPVRIHARSGAQPVDVGLGGEAIVDAILSSLQRHDTIKSSSTSRPMTIDKYISLWLRRLGLAHNFRVTALSRGRRWFEVKLRKSRGSPEVLLADMGFGVSQLLPVLVLCFYVQHGSTLVLEQPDIHLHPSAQTILADVLIDAWEKRGVQILFESHSEHLLRRLQRRIAEQRITKEDISLFFCSSEPDGSSRISHLELDQFGNIANWPKDFFGDQFGEIAAMSDAALARQESSQ